MSQFSGFVGGLTPVTTDDNWTLDAAIDEYGKIIAAQAAGEVTAGAVVRSRVALSASAAGAPTTGDVQNHHDHSPANVIAFVTTYATTQPTLSAGALIPLVFNANGGSIYIITDPNARPQIVGARTISNRNDVGTSQSSYGVVWEEA